ncbi:Mediator of RNA polymerase II transcription subunit 28 [Operophtera brumata]|uniref:Mediator of RNA polymerase II transcription subunit 28 n=1 Tax=Operophtera brumata TaxID=104452 RepID=A0A0L7LNB0_OPEBR|nr:Mediator of RNA polymerase II transcription subunit 28 [Operophtera brumata]
MYGELPMFFPRAAPLARVKPLRCDLFSLPSPDRFLLSAMKPELLVKEDNNELNRLRSRYSKLRRRGSRAACSKACRYDTSCVAAAAVQHAAKRAGTIQAASPRQPCSMQQSVQVRYSKLRRRGSLAACSKACWYDTSGVAAAAVEHAAKRAGTIQAASPRQPCSMQQSEQVRYKLRRRGSRGACSKACRYDTSCVAAAAVQHAAKRAGTIQAASPRQPCSMQQSVQVRYKLRRRGSRAACSKACRYDTSCVAAAAVQHAAKSAGTIQQAASPRQPCSMQQSVQAQQMAAAAAAQQAALQQAALQQQQVPRPPHPPAYPAAAAMPRR